MKRSYNHQWPKKEMTRREGIIKMLEVIPFCVLLCGFYCVPKFCVFLPIQMWLHPWEQDIMVVTEKPLSKSHSCVGALKKIGKMTRVDVPVGFKINGNRVKIGDEITVWHNVDAKRDEFLGFRIATVLDQDMKNLKSLIAFWVIVYGSALFYVLWFGFVAKRGLAAEIFNTIPSNTKPPKFKPRRNRHKHRHKH